MNYKVSCHCERSEAISSFWQNRGNTTRLLRYARNDIVCHKSNGINIDNLALALFISHKIQLDSVPYDGVQKNKNDYGCCLKMT